MEVKQAKRKLTPDQEAWRAAWNGPIHIVRSVAEALKVIGIEAQV